MSKKIVASIECVLNRKVEPVSVIWCNEEVTNNQECHALWGKTDNNLEDDESKWLLSTGELNFLNGQDSHQESGGVNILATVNKRSPKRSRRQPITRNMDFFMDKYYQELSREKWI